MLPQDPIILLSYVNTKLRDEYSSLDELCAALDADEAVVREALAAYQGTIISVSHDRKFLSEVCDKLYRFTERGLIPVENEAF